ncbi:alkaline phosphatase [Tropicimonas sp. IMCC6043]|uniref:alkaline phosphatase D family protein n=1 Tax=Tropicimonas sp. IMCC6043 TaxID=2510645 RepID=UPI00101BDB7C|nr:alkaline phosphatase D family protein [Tropicimonas sp. IMCC6043]RYH10190.1 alkaline phosphatase [Tropicimonas sp. IMCC6043]
MIQKLFLGTALASALAAPAFAADAPTLPYGVQAGDVTADSAIIWSRADRPARMIVEVATKPDFSDARTITGPAALEPQDFTAKVDVTGLPAGSDIHYRVRFVSLEDLNAVSEPVEGMLHTAPTDAQPIRFVWSGDTAGQGWGINKDWGGMRIYAEMAKAEPQFFIHNGDTIYADGPIKPEVDLADGTVWTNVVIPEVEKVAETLDEFRGRYKYNLMDENIRAFNARVPIYVQWDDHETLNNWYPQETLNADDRYAEKSVAMLSARSKEAFAEYMPIRYDQSAERIFRKFEYGPLMDLIMLDMRTYRGPNTANDQTEQGPETVFLGAEQIDWLEQSLRDSTATWKVIASDMPIGLVVRDGDAAFENMANGDGPALGRELEFAEVLKFVKANDIENVVFLTADVHYAAAHYYDPEKAQFTEFKPFWEFVAGPLNAGTFGPNDLDNTFGPQLEFVKAPEGGKANLPPSDGLQFFGQVDIDPDTAVMTVALKDLAGETLYEKALEPAK